MAARHDDTGDVPDSPDRDEVAERWAEIIADLGPLDSGEHADVPDPDPGTGSAVTYPVAPWVSR